MFLCNFKFYIIIMVYERDKFVPKVTEKSLTIPFNEEIMGFI